MSNESQNTVHIIIYHISKIYQKMVLWKDIFSKFIFFSDVLIMRWGYGPSVSIHENWVYQNHLKSHLRSKGRYMAFIWYIISSIEAYVSCLMTENKIYYIFVDIGKRICILEGTPLWSRLLKKLLSLFLQDSHFWIPEKILL